MKSLAYILTLVSVLVSGSAIAQATFVYQTKQSGNWGDFNTWEVDKGLGFVDALPTEIPSEDNATIAINHNVTVIVVQSADQVTIGTTGNLSVSSTGNFTVSADNANGIAISNGGILDVNDGTLENDGSITISNGATFQVSAGATFNTATGSSITNNGAVEFDPSFTNNGSITLNGGSLTIEDDVTNSSDGSIIIGGGVFTMNSGSSIINSGQIDFNGGTFNLPNGASLSSSSGSILLGSPMTINGALNLSGGSLTLDGTGANKITHDGSIVLTGGNLIINADNELEVADGRSISNSGTIITNNGTLEFGPNSIYTHTQNGGSIPSAIWHKTSNLIVQCDANANVGGLNQVFGNVSFDLASAGDFALPAGFNIDKESLFTIDNGSLGSVSLDADLALAGKMIMNGGTFYVNNSNATVTMTVDSSVTINSGTFQLQGNASTSDATLVLNGTVNVSGGQFFVFVQNAAGVGDAIVDINDGGVVNLSSGEIIVHSLGGTGNATGDGKMNFKDGSTFNMTNGELTISTSNASSVTSLARFGTLTFDEGCTSSITGGTFSVFEGAALSRGELYANNNFFLDVEIFSLKMALGLLSIASEGDIFFGGTVTFGPNAKITKETGLLAVARSNIFFKHPSNNDVVQISDIDGGTFGDLIDEISIVGGTTLEFLNTGSYISEVGDEGSRKPNFDMENNAGLIVRNPEGIKEDGSNGSIRFEDRDGQFPANGHYTFAPTTATGNITGDGLPTNLTGTLTIDGDCDACEVDLTQASDLTGATLNLVQGKLELNNNDIRLNPSSTISGGSTTAYVKTSASGVLIQQGLGTTKTGNVTFPVGRSSYNPVYIDNTGGVDATFEARICADGVSDGGCDGAGDAINFNAVGRTWEINHTNGTTLKTGVFSGTPYQGADITLEWDNSADNIQFGFDETQSAISHYTTSTDLRCGGGTSHTTPGWEVQQSFPDIPECHHHNFFGATNTSGTRFTRTAFAVNDFSPFGVSSGSGPLPVDLTRFVAIAIEDGVELSWVTASEENTSHFEVQASEDGSNFETISTIEAEGNSTSALAYSYIDEATYSVADVFYRLKIVDFDGYTEYSDIKVVGFELPSIEVIAYPNPVGDVLTLQFDPNPFIKTIDVLDVTGRAALQYNVEQDQSENGKLEIDMNDLQNGYYVIRFNGVHQQERLIVTKL